MSDIKLTEDEAWALMDAVINCDDTALRNACSSLYRVMYNHYNGAPVEPDTKTIGEQLARRMEEQERDLIDMEKDNKYLRASLKDIENALVLPPGYTTAYLVEQVGVRAKSHDVLRQFMQASGFTDNDGVATMLSVLE